MRKKDEKKQPNKDKNRSYPNNRRNIPRTVLCLFAGIAILAAGLLLPKLVFAGIDRRELGKTYAQKADQSFLTEQETLSAADKLEILQQRNAGSTVNVWYITDVDDSALDTMYPLLREAVYNHILTMQISGVLPEFEFSAPEFSIFADVSLAAYVNAENLNQYMVVAEFTYQTDSGDWLSVTADAETGDILEYSGGAHDRREAVWEELLDADVKGYLMNALSLTDEEFETYYSARIYNREHDVYYIYNNGGTNADGSGYNQSYSDTDAWSIEIYVSVKYDETETYDDSGDALGIPNDNMEAVSDDEGED